MYVIIPSVRDFLKLLLIGIAIFFSPLVFAEEYKVVVIPDNIVTENASLDSYIYDAASEFFADEVVNILNKTDYITAPRVSEIRHILKGRPNAMLAAKTLTERFRATYNVDYNLVKKLAANLNTRYVLLMTSYIDSENYILRRTLWDFLNIAGATVVDPAYKVSTYAVLVDTKTNNTLWSDTFYKTISVCENRIITRGPSPQTEQLQKIKDYSRLLCPEIAQNVQSNVLPADVFAKESNQIYYDIGNIDNVFTKKYRRWGKETDKVYNVVKTDINEKNEAAKARREERRLQKAAEKEKKQLEMQSKLEVEAKPVYPSQANTYTEPTSSVQESGMNKIQSFFKTTSDDGNIKNTVFKKTPQIEAPQDDFIIDIDLKKGRRNSLYGDSTTSRPELRDYSN